MRGTTSSWDGDCGEWTEAEWAWFELGPFGGSIPGLVRRIRRILGVSQRGLARILEVSQSVVARWETGRTYPRSNVLHYLLGLAGLDVTVYEMDTEATVPAMRDDGARDHGGRRYPAHCDLTVTGWWCPRGVDTTGEWREWSRRSRADRDPRIRYRISPWRRDLERRVYGTPDDHPALHQLVAEAEHLDEVHEEFVARVRRRYAS